MYRFEEVESDHLLVSRDAKFMTDMYDGGRRNLLYNEVVVQDDDEATDQDCSQHNQADPENKESAQEKEVKSDSKRHERFQSLEKATKVSRPKLHSQYQSLEEMSATAQDFEVACVVDSVEEMPITFKSAMESNDAAKWKEACSLERTCSTRLGRLCSCQNDVMQLTIDGYIASRISKLVKSSGTRRV